MRRAATRPLLVALGLVLTCAQAARSEREVRVVEVRHRAASDLVPAIEASFADPGSQVVVAGSRNLLVLSGESADVEVGLAVLAQLDRALRTVVVTHEALRTSDLRERGVDVAWTAGSGRVRVGNVRRGGASAAVSVSPRAGRGSSRSSTRTTLRTLEGVDAQMRTDLALPVDSGPWGTVWIGVAGGVLVRPTILDPGRILLELRTGAIDAEDAPRLAARSADATVIVSPGETVAVGAVSTAESSGGRGLGGASRSSSDDEIVFLVSASIEDVEAAAEVPDLRR